MKKKAQSHIEYAVLICIVVAALLTMHLYIKRGLQGNLRQLGDQYSGGGSYAPGRVNALTTIDRHINENSASRSLRVETAEKGSISISASRSTQVTNRAERTLPLETPEEAR